MKIKRFVVSCLLTGSLLAVFASSAGAAADPDSANCVGQYYSSLTMAGQERAEAAQGIGEIGGVGQFLGPAASTNCGQR